jgi:hypothetical protein
LLVGARKERESLISSSINHKAGRKEEKASALRGKSSSKISPHAVARKKREEWSLRDCHQTSNFVGLKHNIELWVVGNVTERQEK